MDEINELTHIDRWFLNNIREIVEVEEGIFWQARAGLRFLLSFFRKPRQWDFQTRRLPTLPARQRPPYLERFLTPV